MSMTHTDTLEAQVTTLAASAERETQRATERLLRELDDLIRDVTAARKRIAEDKVTSCAGVIGSLGRKAYDVEQQAMRVDFTASMGREVRHALKVAGDA